MSASAKLVPIDGAEQTPAFAARHYSPAELGELWGLSADSIRKLFLREPGVLVIAEGSAHGKRRYRTLRIPAAVAERVHRRLTVVVQR
jgi:hypothetical protein